MAWIVVIQKSVIYNVFYFKRPFLLCKKAFFPSQFRHKSGVQGNGIKLRFCGEYFKRGDLPWSGIIQTMCSSCKWLPVDVNWQTWNNRTSQTPQTEWRPSGNQLPCPPPFCSASTTYYRQIHIKDLQLILGVAPT